MTTPRWGEGVSGRQLFDALLEASPVAVVVYDADGEVAHHSSKAAALLAHEATRALADRLARQALDGARAAHADAPAAGPDPDCFWRLQAQPMRTDHFVLSGVLVLAEDVSETMALEQRARTDALTGVLNYGAFHERLVEEAHLAARHGHPLSVALVDVDRFKAINDELGHHTGDAVLHGVARCIGAQARDSDVVGRVGGDEFALLMPYTDGRGAAQVAERVHGAVGSQLFDGTQVTLSIGLCELDEADDPQSMLRLADRALYFAKTRGRDMVWRHARGVESPSVLTTTSALAHSEASAAVRALAHAMDLKDSATRQHSDRVAELAARLAEAMRWAPARILLLREVGRVHDVGKVGIPNAVLLKPAPLTDAELALVQAHAELGAQIASEILTPEQTGWLRAHHERMDGRGYPDGLAESQIPDGARILAVADAYDVMVSDRPYVHPRDPEHAVQELRRCAGRQFDPAVVLAFDTPRMLRQVHIHACQERQRAANARVAPGADGTLHLRCECADPACGERLDLSVEELGAIRSHQRRFLLADGHDEPDVERVVARTPRYVVVEKTA